MFLEYASKDPRFFFTVCFVVVVSICLHELSHGVVAILHGDRTPIESGHMTMNPMVHMGGMSFLLLLLAGIAWGSMPVDPRRLRGRYAPALVAAAGPACNILIAFLALTVIALQVVERWDFAQGVSYLLSIFGTMNIALALFNLLPVPPLDGSRVMANLAPGSMDWMTGTGPGRGAMGIVLILVFLFAGDFIFLWSQQIAGDYLSFAIRLL